MSRLPSIRRLLAVALVLALRGLPAVAAAPADQAPFVRLHTGAGTMVLVLFPELAPHHVDQFLHLATAGFYDGTTFHRIVPGFVIQGGDPQSRDMDPRNDGFGGPTLADVLTPGEQQGLTQAFAPIAARGYGGLDLSLRANLAGEYSKTAKHLRGSVSMAHGRDGWAGSQFFICLDATPQFDRQYSIFGQVIAGMAVADSIAAGATMPSISQHAQHPVPITSIEVLTGAQALTADERAAYEKTMADLATAGSTW